MIHSVPEALHWAFLFDHLKFSFPASFQCRFSLVVPSFYRTLCSILFHILSFLSSLFSPVSCVFLDFSLFLASLSSLSCLLASSLSSLNVFINFLLDSLSWNLSELFFTGTITNGLVLWERRIFFNYLCFCHGTCAPGVRLLAVFFCYVSTGHRDLR